jgi:hypothetical protein
MKYLVVLKRFEIWLLLVVAGFLVVQAFRSDDPKPGREAEKNPVVLGGNEVPAETEPRQPEDESIESDFQVEAVEVAQSGQGRIVEVTLLARSVNGQEIEIDESTLRAETESGVAVNHFFEPFRTVERISPDEPSLVTAKFWLEEPAAALWIRFQGERRRAELRE